ncbi:ABC transporter, partial [Sulfolobus sp. C3]
ISDLKKKVYNLSAGQSSLFYAILSLASDPKYVMIDEPFENVDYAKRKILINWFKEYGEAGLVVTHELDMLTIFNNYSTYLIFDGKVYGPIRVEDFLESSIINGEDPSALLVLEIKGRKFSLVKGKGEDKIRNLGNIDKLYLVV